MTLMRQIRATAAMARDVGMRPTFERVHNFARARLLNRSRAAQFRRLGLKEPLVRDILGYRMRLDPRRDGIDRDLLLDGIREPIATGHLMRVLRPDDVVLEVGANLGYYALLEARLCRKVYAVEPHPDNFVRLNENIALNGYDNIETFNLALGSIAGEIPMRCSDLSNWHSCHDAQAGEKGTIMVPCLRIDDFVKGKDPPTFVKMDVEGFELEVLKGATETLKETRCVFVEVHGDILSAAELREAIDVLRGAELEPSLVAQYDRPGLSRTYPLSHVDQISAGDRGTYELFFSRER